MLADIWEKHKPALAAVAIAVVALMMSVVIVPETQQAVENQVFRHGMRNNEVRRDSRRGAAGHQAQGAGRQGRELPLDGRQLGVQATAGDGIGRRMRLGAKMPGGKRQRRLPLVRLRCGRRGFV